LLFQAFSRQGGRPDCVPAGTFGAGEYAGYDFWKAFLALFFSFLAQRRMPDLTKFPQSVV